MNMLFLPMQSVGQKFTSWSIFDKEELEYYKNIFTTKKEQFATQADVFTAGYGSRTIECYYSDKNFSTELQIEAIKNIANAILDGINLKIEEGINWDFSKTIDAGRPRFLHKILGDYQFSLDSSKRHDFVQEFGFFDRILIRAQTENEVETKKILLKSKKEEFSPALLNAIERMMEMGVLYYKSKEYTAYLTDEEKETYYTFCNEFFLKRDQDMYNSLKEKLEKDIEAREKNPNAPLSNLVRLSSYERRIYKKRLKLSLKIIGSLFIRVVLLKDIRNLYTYLFNRSVKKSALA